jgi:hypothetical protein
MKDITPMELPYDRISSRDQNQNRTVHPVEVLLSPALKKAALALERSSGSTR